MLLFRFQMVFDKIEAFCLLFKPLVTLPISQRLYDLNNKLLIHYSSHDLNNEPLDEQTILIHLNTTQFSIQIPTILESY